MNCNSTIPSSTLISFMKTERDLNSEQLKPSDTKNQFEIYQHDFEKLNSQVIFSNFSKFGAKDLQVPSKSSSRNMNKSQQNMFRQASQSNPLNIFQTLFAANLIRNNMQNTSLNNNGCLNFSPFTLNNVNMAVNLTSAPGYKPSFDPENEDKGTLY